MTMTMNLSDITLWQRTLASLIRSGLLAQAEVLEAGKLYTVVGVYKDGTHSAPLAKYADRRRAEDAVAVIMRLAEKVPAGIN